MHCGRAARLSPATIDVEPITAKASRSGEICLKHDLVGTAVRRWFSQLRRLQSYLHSVKAGKLHDNAVRYREEVWQAILDASGFDGGFRKWWASTEFEELLGPIPCQPPTLDKVEWIFTAFQIAFRRFEQWHLNQKSQLIQAKYDRSYKAVFQDLRDPKPDQIDLLWDVDDYVVLAIRPENRSALLNKALVLRPGGKWYCHGHQLSLEKHMDELVVFADWPDLQPGQHITCEIHTQNDHDVHAELIQLWQPRWTQTNHVDDAILARASNFVQAFMPSVTLTLDDISPDEWYATVRRLRPSAARGPDGFARLDLLHMPLQFVQVLLAFLMDIEKGNTSWPQQLLEGFVLTIAKHSEAHTANGYRPIVLFSMVYRCWASLRCRQLLSQLEAHVHSEAYGFLPTRETMQSWLQIQSAVEMALQTGSDLSGLATDLVKAFNHIQREPWLMLAKHIGIPTRILGAWQDFLRKFTRRFSVNNHLSEPLSSNVGFAEGDPLSVMAMVVLDWALHQYQAQLAPGVRTMTFVDNISLLAMDTNKLIMAFFSLKAFLQFWGLQADTAKTYCWSTVASTRTLLQQLGVSVVQDVAELGGSLTLGASRRVRLMLARGKRLEAKWLRLRISRAPLCQKLHCLALVFWPAALHGALGCVFSDAHIHALRKKAVGSIGVKRGGANSLLRLSFSKPMTADPGFYQLRCCIHDFRRICLKSPDIAQLWRFYMRGFTGKARPGPFYKLNELFCQIGWSLAEAPCFYDHDGCLHDLFALPMDVLDALLQDGWLQATTHQVRHRATMTALKGIDIDLLDFIQQDLTAAELGRVMALQTGAFISQWQHAKYDRAKQAVCQLCFQPATQKHWFSCPLYAQLRAQLPGLDVWADDVPDCTLHHLLVPRSPLFSQMKEHLMHLEDTVNVFLSQPSQGPQHVFCDGSFFAKTPKILSTAAWAVVNATTSQLIGTGVVPGLCQSIARAELCGVLATALWCRSTGAQVFLWSDSNTTVRFAQRILLGTCREVGVHIANFDLWQQLQEVVEGLYPGQLQICWIPSHLDDCKCDDDLEEWVAHWNGVADAFAVSTNTHRGARYAQLAAQLIENFQFWRTRLLALRSFYFGVASLEIADEEVVDLTRDDLAYLSPDADPLSLSEAIAVNWQSQLVASPFKYPHEFVFAIFEGIFCLETQPEISMSISFIELTLWLVQDRQLPIPVWDTKSNGWVLRSYDSLLLRPTLASVLFQVKLAVKHGTQMLGLQDFIRRDLHRIAAGINMPTEGLFVHLSTASAARMQDLSCTFATNRRIRKTADLAKPF